ncbi:hypothetical protein HOA88_00605 [Candidatus Woesearchaeota archaeon]|nr:hypothetical protein [Candidatus Woesearchaeota archaeon]
MVRLFRKGDLQHSTMILLIMAGIGLIIYSLFFASLKDVVEATAEDEVCRTSAAIKARTGVMGAESSVDLKCSINDFESDAMKKEEVKLELAKEMYRCWYKYGEGKLDFYGGWDWLGSETHCLICSRIGFRDDVEEVSFGEFDAYLNSPLPGREETFAEYFTQTPNAKIQLGSPSGEGNVPPESKMNLSQGVYVVFRVNKYNEDNQAIASLFSGEESNVGDYPGDVAGAAAYQGGISYIAGAEVVSGFTDAGGNIFVTHVKGGQYFVRTSSGKFATGFGAKTYGSVAELNAAAKLQKLTIVSKSGLRSLIKRSAMATQRAGVAIASTKVGKKVAGNIAVKAGGKVASRFIPVAGWALLAYDATSALAWAGELHPSIVLYGVSDINGVCDILS